MNKDIVGLVCWELYRKNIDNVVKEYGVKFEMENDRILYKSSMYRLNWRLNMYYYKNMYKYIYDFRTTKYQKVLSKNYF